MMNYRKKDILKWLLLFAYAFTMGFMYIYYKSLPPTFDSSLLNGGSYLIDTPGYKLLNFSPFDDSVTRFIEPPPHELDCSRRKRPLTTGKSTTASSTLRSISTIVLHEEHRSDYGVESFSCCYQSISRNGRSQRNSARNLEWRQKPDVPYFVEKSCHPLERRISVIENEAVLVTCSSKAEVIYMNVHIFVTFNLTSNAKDESCVNKPKDHLSTLILGLDSVSRINMQRYMPKTRKVLSNIGALELRGYNKNGENTFPNLIALLTGYLESDPQIEEKIKSRRGFYDEIPFIWKNFSAAGYETFFGEDCTAIGTFTYNRKGFEYTPTDHYLYPYLKASEELIGWKGGLDWISRYKICLGFKSSLDVLLDYAKDLSRVLVSKPYFSLLWSSSFTHDRLQFAGLADSPVSNFIQNMYNEDKWNNTIVFLISDHGIRFGKIRETYIGKIEESLPFSYVLLPKWFKKAYPTAYRNLYHNQFKLTTPLDIFETLKDILAKTYENENIMKKRFSLLKSDFKFSLFHKIPDIRTCSDAKIPVNYCAGMVAKEIPASYHLNQAAQIIIEFVNSGLKAYPDCHQLRVSQINKAFVVEFFDKEPRVNVTNFSIQITTFPGKAILEAVVKSITTDSGQHIFSIVGDVSRLNSYERQSYCISDTVYVKYCLCKISSQ